MPPSADDRLRDILSAIEKIERATSGMNVTEFTDNEIVRAATERFLGVVCEASLRLPDSIKQQATGIDWRNMPTTIYERLAEHKLDSVIYYHDSTMALSPTPSVRTVKSGSCWINELGMR